MMRRATQSSGTSRRYAVFEPSGGFLYRGHMAMQNRLFPEVFESFFAEVRPATVIEIGAARGGFTYFLAEMRARYGFRLSAYDLRQTEDLGAIVAAERVPFAALDVLGTLGFERISAEIRSEGVSVVCCDGGAKTLEIARFGGQLKRGDFILAHDYAPTREYFETRMRGQVWQWLEITDPDVAEACAAHGLVAYEKDWFLHAAWLCLRRGTSIRPRLSLRPRPEPPRPANPSEVRGFIVRALAAQHRSTARAALDAALTEPVDWEAVLEMADAESVSSLLYRALRDIPAVPRAVVAVLKGRYREATARRLCIAHALAEIVAALRARDIEPIALPGAGLELDNEDVDFGSRNDFDLAIERRQLRTAMNVLTSLGYTLCRPETGGVATLPVETTLTLSRHRGAPIRLVMRCGLKDASADAWLRTTARRISIGEASLLTLGPEAQILHLAHPSRDDDLRRFNAIAALIAASGDRIDYALLFRRASEWGLAGEMRTLLLALANDWHAPSPPEGPAVGT